MMDESVRLMTLQQTLEKEADGKVAFFGQSVNETIRTCLINGMAKRADKIKSDFKVPDKRYVVCMFSSPPNHSLSRCRPGSGTSSCRR